jgi:formiminotetrahydrofolate cyclodeaminase
MISAERGILRLMSDLRIGSMPVEALVTKLGSDAMTPGSGAAGALALALAAACASKAIAITAKHRALPEALANAAPVIAQLREAALHGADADAEQFRQYLQHRNGATAEELRHTDRTLIELCASLNTLLDRIAADVHPIVAGDITAARALLAAASAIHQRNEATTPP